MTPGLKKSTENTQAKTLPFRFRQVFISVVYHGIIPNTLAVARETTLLLIFATLQNGYRISVYCSSMPGQPSLA